MADVVRCLRCGARFKVADADKAKKSPLNVTTRPTGAHIFAAEYFAEEVRRWVYDKYGEKQLYGKTVTGVIRSTFVSICASMKRNRLWKFSS